MEESLKRYSGGSMPILHFEQLNLTDYDRVYEYTSKYGEGSCQHSFVSMYCLSEKYGDAICEYDGFLFTLRRNLCDANYRVYLAPLGEGDLKAAYSLILDNAKRHKKKVKFCSLTESHAKFLKENFPGVFEIEYERGLAEYIYKSENLAYFPGRGLKERRHEVNKFWKTYGDRAVCTRITADDLDDIMAFEMNWLHDNKDRDDIEMLRRESRMMHMQIDIFNELRLSGVVLRIDGEVNAFGYGVKLSDDYFDAILEKGDRNNPLIYKVIRQESVKQCAMDCKYVNMEEDLGFDGLRLMKMKYHPEYLIEKYIVTER